MFEIMVLRLGFQIVQTIYNVVPALLPVLNPYRD